LLSNPIMNKMPIVNKWFTTNKQTNKIVTETRQTQTWTQIRIESGEVRLLV
jgi:hypothetical protein